MDDKDEDMNWIRLNDFVFVYMGMGIVYTRMPKMRIFTCSYILQSIIH